MSSEIFYDRAYILVGDKFIPVVNHGSNNCFEFYRGREVAERYWSVLNYPNHSKMLFTAEEMREVADMYEQINMDNRGGTRKSRNHSFDEGEFRRWILGGMQSAHTVEEYRTYGNAVVVIDYGDHYRKHPVFTTSELLEKLEKLAAYRIGVSFYDNRHVTQPPTRKRGADI